jgi:hypothetical protein
MRRLHAPSRRATAWRKARQEADTAAVDGRAAASMPVVSVMAGYTRTNHIVPFGLPPEKPTAIIYPDIPDNWRTRLDMQWPVYTFGRFESMERAARSEAAAVEKDVATFTADVRFDAARAFWALVTAAESVRWSEDLALIEAPARREEHAGGASRAKRRTRRRASVRGAGTVIEAAQHARRRRTDWARYGLGPGVGHGRAVSKPAAGRRHGPVPTPGTRRRAPGASGPRGCDRRAARRRCGAEAVLAVGAGFVRSQTPSSQTDEWHASGDVGVNFSWPRDGGP